MMKRIFSIILVALGLTVIGATSAPQQAEAQVVYCGHCCDTDVYGNARIRCTLVSAFPCGGTCECVGIAGYGFACY